MAKKAGNPDALATSSAARGGAPHGSALVDTRVIYCGDNLGQLATLPDACVDLIYIDPPFSSNYNFEIFWAETKEKQPFEDRSAGTLAYIDYMRPRCVELARVLKKTGAFYYHCDWHVSHYVKVMLDEILGENNFHNEVIWKRTTTNYKQRAGEFGPAHDVLFFYSKGASDWTFNTQYVAYSQDYIESQYPFVEEGTGRRYRKEGLTTTKGGTGTEYEWIGPDECKLRLDPGKYWVYSQAKMQELERQGRIIYTSAGMPKYKRYLDEVSGKALDDVWDDIDLMHRKAQERLGYPTQKPLALLERIIQIHSNPNDIVLDAFCGSGTAIVAAQKLNRRWIGIDISPTACRVVAKRLHDICHMNENQTEWRSHSSDAFVVRNLPWTIEKLKAIPSFEFENWAISGLGGIPNKLQANDIGIDGRIFPVDSRPSRDKNSLFEADWFPIQVKQLEKVGPPDIRAFEAVMHREDRKRGFFVAFSFTADARQETAAFNEKLDRFIELITVQEILDGEHTAKL